MNVYLENMGMIIKYRSILAIVKYIADSNANQFISYSFEKLQIMISFLLYV